MSHIASAGRAAAMCQRLVVSSGWSVASPCHRMLGTANASRHWPKASIGPGTVGGRKSILKAESHLLKCPSGRFLAPDTPLRLCPAEPAVPSTTRHAIGCRVALRCPHCLGSEQASQGSAMCSDSVGDYPSDRRSPAQLGAPGPVCRGNSASSVLQARSRKAREKPRGPATSTRKAFNRPGW